MKRIALSVILAGCVHSLFAQSPAFEVASIKLNGSGASATTLVFQQNGRFKAVNEPLWRLIAEASMKRLSFAFVLLLHAVLLAQSPSFEVVSVKANQSDSLQARGGVLPGGRFSVQNWPLYQLISIGFQAYRDFQIEGAPAWTRTSRFDIDAKAPAGVTLGALASDGPPTPAIQMLRSLLMDRFNVKAHWETREVPAYGLVIARGDGKLGPKLLGANTDCAAERLARLARNEPAPKRPAPTPGQPVTCIVVSRPGWFSAGSYPIAALIPHLADQMNAPVIDKTRLSGFLDIDLSYVPDQRGSATASLDDVALRTALQEQLGLKLEATKAPVEVLVIDHVERPTEN